jgi:hypothetical protein
MALWDAVAKIAGLPLYQHLANRHGGKVTTSQRVAVYAGGGYYYPTDDLGHLGDEVRRFRDLDYDRVKIKIGGAPQVQDLRASRPWRGCCPTLATSLSTRSARSSRVHTKQTRSSRPPHVSSVPTRGSCMRSRSIMSGESSWQRLMSPTTCHHF